MLMSFLFESVINIYHTVTDPFFGKKTARSQKKRKRSSDEEGGADSANSKENVDSDGN